KSAVKNVCRLSGMHATFAPKPMKNEAGSGLRVVLALRAVSGQAPLEQMNAFACGVLQKARELLPFFNTTPESISLLDELRAPVHDHRTPDRSAYIRVLPPENGEQRIEINAADCLCNQFLAFALLLEAGIYGIENACMGTKTVFPAEGEPLPRTLSEAAEYAANSPWLAKVLGRDVLDEYVRAKRGGATKA
ncbi:MAG: glutamine synthetase, partial [Clostridiales bacterium]|nr:glutamine synthetase [Clostridiales bacterium]